MSALPTTAEELDRKVLNELGRVTVGLSSREAGLVSAAASVQTIWDIASGLVPEGTMQVVAQLSNGLQAKLREKNLATQIALMLGAPGGAVVIARRGAVVEVSSFVGSHKNEPKVLRAPADSPSPELWASEEFGRHYVGYMKQGFTTAFLQ